MSRTEFDTLLDSLKSSKRKPLAPEVGHLRAIKSKYEQKVMQQGADISARAHNKVCHRLLRCVLVKSTALSSGRQCGSRSQGCQNTWSRLISSIYALVKDLSDLHMCLSLLQGTCMLVDTSNA